MSETTIKIHNEDWFKEHCCLCTDYFCTDVLWNELLIPKGALWERLNKKSDVIHWIAGGDMSTLVGKELKVMRISKKVSASMMNSSRYFAGGYWIPNWAIEWVKED